MLKKLDIPIPPIKQQDIFVKVVQDTVDLKQKMLAPVERVGKSISSLNAKAL